jgi:hypothetical protein
VTKQTFELGTLLVRYHSGETAIVTETKEDRTEEYGKITEKRRIYRLFQQGQFFWMKDIEVRAKYYTPKQTLDL